MRRWYMAVASVLSLAVVQVAVASPGKTVQSFEGNQPTFVVSISAPAAGPGPFVEDRVQLSAVFGPLVQGGIQLDRVYFPGKMIGTVTGTVVGFGPTILRGTLRGVIMPDGMHGVFELTRTSVDFPGQFYRIHGRWSSDGHPVAPSPPNIMPTYTITFDGVEIGPFPL